MGQGIQELTKENLWKTAFNSKRAGMDQFEPSLPVIFQIFQR